MTVAVIVTACVSLSQLAISQQWAEVPPVTQPEDWPHRSGSETSSSRGAVQQTQAQMPGSNGVPETTEFPGGQRVARPAPLTIPQSETQDFGPASAASNATSGIVVPPPWPGRSGANPAPQPISDSRNQRPAPSPQAQRVAPQPFLPPPTPQRVNQQRPQQPPATNKPAVQRPRGQSQSGLARMGWEVPPAPEPLAFEGQGAEPIGAAEPQINVYAEVTPRNKVSANQWKGPTVRPVNQIQQTGFVSRIQPDEAGEMPVEALLHPYAERAADYPDKVPQQITDGQLKELPKDFAPWWDAVINKSMRGQSSSLQVDAESLVLKALEHSPQITAMRIDPTIREWIIYEEQADFDWTAFLDTNFDDKSEPIGSALIRNNAQVADRFRDSNVSGKAGFKKKLDQGGRIDVSQKVGYEDNNAAYFIPNYQGTTRMELNFTQPLLRGAGSTVAQSRIVLAQLDQSFSAQEMSEKLQEHLVAVYQAYWSLYRARASRLQKDRLFQRAVQISELLEARQGIDSLNRQVLRAKAAVASRRSEIIRSDMAIRNAESQLRLLVNSQDLKERSQIEMLPTELPLAEEMEVSLRGSIETAITHRPDVSQAIQRIKTESLRLGVAKNELLPKLDVLFGTYVNGLRGRGDVSQSFEDQFTRGRPSFTVGILFEYPLGNRAAKARHERREWELMKSIKEFEAAVESGMTEVEIAVREMDTSYQEMLSHFQAMIAAENEAQYLEERWKLLPGNDQTISFVLEDILDAQERVASQESDFVNAQVAYVLAIVNLKRSTGILLKCNCETQLVKKKAPSNSPIPLPLPEPLDLPLIQPPKQ